MESPEQPPQVSIHVAKFSESGIGGQSDPKSLLFTKLKSWWTLAKIRWDHFESPFFKEVVRNDQNAPKVLAQQRFDFCVLAFQGYSSHSNQEKTCI